MFDFAFSEMLVVALVALIVLGPERLPRAARFAGLWVRRARAQWYSVRSELERELAAEELKRSLAESRAAIDQAGHAWQQAASDVQADADVATGTDADAGQPEASAPDATPGDRTS